jgi:arginase
MPGSYPNGFSVIAMPYELDRLRHGVGNGPERLLEAGAVKALASAGADVRSDVIELEEPFDNQIDASFELMRQVGARVKSSVGDGAFPVILSGSCFASVGVVAGLGDSATGVVWLDAHGDFNNPETAIFGYLDGMGTAILTGSAWQGLLSTVPGARPLPEAAVVLAGARDFDPPEEERLAASAIVQVPPDELGSPEALLTALRSAHLTGLYLHVDLDVLDVDEAQVNVYSAGGGIDGDQLASLVKAILDEFDVRAMSLTAYDPNCDPEERVPEVAIRLLRLLAERRAG